MVELPRPGLARRRPVWSFPGAHAEAVRSLRGAWLDAGNRDEYFLDLGVTALRDALLDAGLPTDRLRFELFDGGHRGLGERYPASLAWLVERLERA